MKRRYHLFSFVEHLFFPTRCPYCRRAVEFGQTACFDCRQRLGVLEGGLLVELPSQIDALSAVYTCYFYQPTAKTAVWNLKFHQNEALAQPMGEDLAKVVERHLADRVDLLVPVPLSKQSLRRRGFNQAAAMARTLHRVTGIPLKPRLLCKTRETMSQHSLNSLDRASNLVGAFCVNDPRAVAGKRILLVDDVCTTGWTMQACASALLAAGAKEVYGICYARAGWAEDKEEPLHHPQSSNA